MTTTINTSPETEMDDRIQGDFPQETPVLNAPPVETPAIETPFAFRGVERFLADQKAKEAAVLEEEKAASVPSLPKTLQESHDLLLAVQGSVPKDRLEAIGKKNKVAALAAHIHALSQSPAPPRIDHAAFSKELRTPPAAARERVAQLYPKAPGKKS